MKKRIVGREKDDGDGDDKQGGSCRGHFFLMNCPFPHHLYSDVFPELLTFLQSEPGVVRHGMMLPPPVISNKE